jgi:hypothetical protein
MFETFGKAFGKAFGTVLGIGVGATLSLMGFNALKNIDEKIDQRKLQKELEAIKSEEE